MRYTIDDIEIETSKPRIDLTLPVGVHIYELVVTDSTGKESRSDSVTITVKGEGVQEPSIDDITPRLGLRGETIYAEIHGDNLDDAYDLVKFTRDSGEDSGVKVTIKEGGDKHVLPISIRIKDDAVFGAYNFSLTTPGGTAQNPSDKTFRVVGRPKITDIDPPYTRKGKGFVALALITGEHLLLEGEPLSAHEVQFYRGENLAPHVKATITDNSTPEQLEVEIKVDAEATLGPHTFVVKTPAGEAHSLPDRPPFVICGPLDT